MKTEIPEFLIELSKQMNQQDNYGTAHPFFQVRNKRYVITEEDYNEHHWEIVSLCDNEVVYRSDIDSDFSRLAEDLDIYHPEWCVEWTCHKDLAEGEDEMSFSDVFNLKFDPTEELYLLPENYKKIRLQEVEEVISTHLTEAEADWFIERKEHDYPRAYKWTASAYWSNDIKNLQDWIKGLTEKGQ